jgi:hypothetical protein
MKIYTELVFDLKSGKLLRSRACAYSGPVALCKGSGGSTVNSTDPVYNAGLLLLQQSEEGRSSALYNQFMYGVDYNPSEEVYGATIDGKWVSEDELKDSPYSKDYMTANPKYEQYQAQLAFHMMTGKSEEAAKRDLATKGIVEPKQYIVNENRMEKKTRGELQGYDADAITSEMEYLQNQVTAANTLLPAETELSRTQLGTETQKSLMEGRLLPLQEQAAAAQLSDSVKGIAERAPVRTAFYQSALNGVDVTARQNQAQAGVEHAFGTTQRGFERTLRQSGARPGDGGYIAAQNERELAKTKGIAGARTGARNLAEDEMFKRLQSAMGSS